MASSQGTVLERATFVVLHRATLRNYPQDAWLHNPDFAPVTQQDGSLWPSKYWKLRGDVLSLMSEAERDVVDAAEDSVETARARAEAKGRWDTDRALISLANVVAPKLFPVMSPAELVDDIKADIDAT